MEYKESDTVELKAELTEEVKEEIVAFLNTNGGKVFVGVDDYGNVLPNLNMTEKEKDILENKVENWTQQAFYPLPSNLVHSHYNKDGVLVIDVKEGTSKPYYLKEKGPKPSGVYKRVGRSKRKATDDEILSMIMNSKDYSYEDDVSEEQELSFSYFEKICRQNKIPFSERSRRTLKLIDRNGRWTNLAYLLSDQNPVEVKFAKYDANMNFLVKSTFKGSLLKILDETMEHTESFNVTSAIIDGSTFQRIEKKSFPGASIREAVMNAFGHANYFIRSNIKIEFFPKYLRITNPGGIYQATLEDILNGVQTYRNPGLIRILDKLHYIENFGTGIPRILNAYSQAEKKPIFHPTESFFILELPDLNYDPLNDPLNDSLNDPLNASLNDFELLILREIQKNPGENARKILENILPEDKTATINRVRNALKRSLSELVEFTGAKKGGGYSLKKGENSDAQK